MNRIRRALWSVLARFRKPLAVPARRQITTAEAWDLWREASCDERGLHSWETPKWPFGRDYKRDHVTFSCRCCPATVDVYPADGEIRLPWGVAAPVETGTCKHCGAGFRWIKTGVTAQEYCSRGHANAARRVRTQPERMAAREASLQVERAAAEEAIRLAACAARGKVRYEDKHTASLAAGRYELTLGVRQYPYKCPCGSWHLTKEPPDARQKAEAVKRVLFG